MSARMDILKDLLDKLRADGTLEKLNFLGVTMEVATDEYHAARGKWPDLDLLSELPTTGPIRVEDWRMGARDGLAACLHPHHPPVFLTTKEPRP